jgi:hypothetical protein
VNPIDDLLAAADAITDADRSTVVAALRRLETATDRAREWRARGQLSDEELLRVFNVAVNATESGACAVDEYAATTAGLRAVERAVREHNK